jgi:hypothetical protein
MRGQGRSSVIDILVIAVCAVIACAESWDDIALYGRNKLGWLRSFLSLANGIPSHDTFRRVFGDLRPVRSIRCPSNWSRRGVPGVRDGQKGSRHITNSFK